MEQKKRNQTQRQSTSYRAGFYLGKILKIAVILALMVLLLIFLLNR